LQRGDFTLVGVPLLEKLLEGSAAEAFSSHLKIEVVYNNIWQHPLIK
jgi:hypothetical protein